MKHEWKALAFGMGVSLALYLLLPLLYGYLMLGGTVKESETLAWNAASAGIAAAVGTLLARRNICTLPPALLALFTGPVVQLIAALLGWLVFTCGFQMGERRWVLLLASLACALPAGVVFRPKGRKRRNRTHAAKKRR